MKQLEKAINKELKDTNTDTLEQIIHHCDALMADNKNPEGTYIYRVLSIVRKVCSEKRTERLYKAIQEVSAL